MQDKSVLSNYELQYEESNGDSYIKLELMAGYHKTIKRMKDHRKTLKLIVKSLKRTRQGK